MANASTKDITKTGKKRANSHNGQIPVRKLLKESMSEIANKALGNAGTAREKFKKKFSTLMGEFTAFALFTTEMVCLKPSSFMRPVNW